MFGHARHVWLVAFGVLACTGGPAPQASSAPTVTHASSGSPGPSVRPGPPSVDATPGGPHSLPPSTGNSPSARRAIELIGSQPVLAASDLGDGHYGAILPAAYFLANGARHLYAVGFGEAMGDQRVFHASSIDGLAWAVDDTDPFAGLGLELSPPGPVPGSVVQARDGDWWMYLWGYPAPQRTVSALFRATADDPAGPWIADAEPVLQVGDRGDWDDGAIDFPSVTATADGYLMLYAANGGDHPNEARIGGATSPDGIAWDKLGLLLQPEACGGVDSDFIAIPRIAPFEDEYVLLFLLSDEIGMARSSDGAAWTCADDFPLLTHRDIPRSTRIHTLAAARDGDDISLVIESLFNGDGGEVISELWLGRLAVD